MKTPTLATTARPHSVTPEAQVPLWLNLHCLPAALPAGPPLTLTQLDEGTYRLEAAGERFILTIQPFSNFGQ
jgi:hypothetical protein